MRFFGYAFLVMLAVVSCVKQPSPWTPDSRRADDHGRDTESGDGFGDVLPTDWTAVELLDSVLDVSSDSPVLDVMDDLGEPSDAWFPADQGDLFDSVEDLESGSFDVVSDLEDVPLDQPCIPACEGRECGDDGCGGTCWSGPGGECDDANPCTQDSCQDGAVCQHLALEDGSACDDDNVCWLGDSCVDGICEGGAVLNTCDDGNDCTVDTCKPAGCEHIPLMDGSSCDDGTVCTLDDSCVGGVCMNSGELDCDDGIDCSVDLCHNVTGCTHEVAAECAGDDDDWDNDGLLNLEDKCPYAFDPGNPDTNGIPGPDACELLADHGVFLASYPIVLSAGAADSPVRRTHEPVEILLSNAPFDSTPDFGWQWDNGLVAEVSGLGTTKSSGVAPTLGPGGHGGAFALSGQESYIDLSALSVGTGQDVTIMVWFRYTGDPLQQQALFSTSSQVVYGDNKPANWSGINIRLGARCQYAGWQGKQTAGNWGYLYASFGIDDNCWAIGTPTPVVDEEWHHVALVLTDPEDIPHLYLDGTLVTSGTEPVQWNNYYARTVWGATQTWDISPPYTGPGYGNHFEGDLADPMVFHRVLSPGEIWTYVESKAPYGTVFLNSPAGDYSDFRLTEKPGPGEPGPETVKRLEVNLPAPGQTDIPKLRFLANTTVTGQGPGEDASFPAREYTLHVGLENPPAVAPYVPDAEGNSCDGLLNKCLGYYGYWPLNGDGRDAAKGQRNMTHSAQYSPAYGVGMHGLAEEVPGDSYCLPDQLDADDLLPEALTLEVAFWSEDNDAARLLSNTAKDYDLTIGDSVLTLAAGGLEAASFDVSTSGVEVKTWHSGRATLATDSISVQLDESPLASVVAQPVLGPDWDRLCFSNWGGGAASLTGFLDEVRVMLRALPEDEFLHYPRFTAAIGPMQGCQSNCSGRECGYDGCLGSCGTCSETATCDNEYGVCVPDGFVLVEPGDYTIGFAGGACGEDGGQVVTVSVPYIVSRREVTQEQWNNAGAGANPSYFRSGNLCEGALFEGACPVDKTNLFDALWYCNKRSIQEGLTPCYELAGCNNVGYHCGEYGLAVCNYNTCSTAKVAEGGCDGYRLPTHTEWEIAARGGVGDATYPFPVPLGTNIDTCVGCDVFDALSAYVNCDCTDLSKSAGAGVFAPNPWGLYETVGNLNELVSPFSTNPDLVVNQLTEVEALGGAFNDDCHAVTPMTSMSLQASEKRYDTGFRVVRTMGLN